MKTTHNTKKLLQSILAVGMFGLASAPAYATVDYFLAAKAYNKTMPDGSSVPMWGYVEDTGDGTNAHCFDIIGTGSQALRNDCVAALPDPVSPGPRLTAGVGDPNFRIYLTNGLQEPTSLVIPGLELPWSATDNGPTWNDGTTGPRGTDLTKRVRSFGREAAANGGRRAYVWNINRATAFEKTGTFLYHSGTHPQKQVYMGLFGAVTKDSAVGEVYPGVSYDNEVVLFYSDIDPVLNASIADGTYTTSIEHHPTWFLINGEPYASGMADIPAGAAGGNTLLRLLSAAGETHVPVLQGLYMDIHAEDGFPYSWQDGATGVATHVARTQYSAQLPPLKTKDAIISAAAEGRYAVYDGNGYMTNPSDPNNPGDGGDAVGGMLRFLSFSAAADADGDGVANGLDLCPGTPAGEVVDANGCSATQLDDDSDGVNNSIDQCPGTPAGAIVDQNGCPIIQADDDGDGVDNLIDLCPATPAGEAVDANGCSATQLDDDSDGVNNSVDQCPATPAGEAVDAAGCSATQLDDDSDGVNNALDLCPATPAGEPVDADGCALSQLDSDGDGVADNVDLCPNTPQGAAVDADGCPTANLVPVAVADSYSVDEDAILDVAAAGVLGNDTDGDGDALTAVLDTGPSNARPDAPNAGFVLNSDGSFHYEPDVNFFGTDSFTYHANDGTDDSNVVTVTITVNSMNDAPIAVADTVYLNQMGTVVVPAPTLLANDNDVDDIPFDPAALTAVQETDPNRGTMDAWSGDGGFTYTFANGRVDTIATFDYHANDGLANSNTVTVTLVRLLSVQTATCEHDIENGVCSWDIAGRVSNAVPNGTVIQAWLGDFDTGTLIGEHTETGGAPWNINPQNNIIPTTGAVINVRAVGSPNAFITGVPVNIQ